MARQATWAATGVDVAGANCIEQVLSKAKLDYTVEKEDICLLGGQIIRGKYATTRPGTDGKHVFGVVGNNYTICQNRDAFEFVNYIEEDIEFVKAGETAGGRIYIIAKLPETYVLDDKFTPYVIFQNGHNGTLSVKAAIAPLRIVCQNQFNVAFKKADNSISIKHASTLDAKLKNAREVLKTSASYMNTFKVEAEALAKIKVPDPMQMIESFYVMPEDATARTQERIEQKRADLMYAYRNTGDNGNYRGTAWGLVNAYADVVTHAEPIRYTAGWEETRFSNVTFKPEIMQKFIRHVKESA